MVALVLAPVLLGVALYKLPLAAARVLALLGQAGLGAATVALLARTARDGELVDVLGGTQRLLHVTLRADAAALTFVLLSVVLFSAAIVYVLGERYASTTLLLLLLALQGLTAGLFLADDIFTLFVLFEVATLVGILLVMFRVERRSVYDGLFYLTIQIVAMLFFLFGVAYLYRAFGVLDVTEIGRLVATGADPHALVLPFAFLLTGLALKAGFFPLFSYVPRAYGNPGAPTVVLMLMSGVLATGAMFWVARLVAVFVPALDLRGFLVALGLLTGVAGAVKALAQQDVRLILAYSTVSQAGLVTIGLAAGTATATGGGLLHLVNHALLKSVLFLAAGVVVRTYGTAKLAELRGVARRLPWVAGASMVAVLGMVGAPLTGAAASKDLILLGATGWAEVAAWVVNAGTMLVFLKYGAMFFGTPATPAAAPRRGVDPTQRVVVLALTAVALAAGVLAPQLSTLMLGPDVVAAVGVSATKVGVFALLAVGAYLLRRATLPYARQARGLLLTSLSLPQSVVALTVFFGVTALAGTVAVR
ncbi:complex I subunit 5 family protein [Xylanimonas protaetiae]|uniref:NADH:quinone oxidoreductase/Mrp antiporter transmembrane domain-containing protein n=1 Tax=Xylanimonas protaetiae TaxID=2509457 RepID=A0A4P6F7X3_9MICO|nr:proton-conducting transporter membrane subunit [Xylanimonas protaetiae]QAY70973.1 hypothetical protein ET471_13835 [Xylanimonas protaetiae]